MAATTLPQEMDPGSTDPTETQLMPSQVYQDYYQSKESSKNTGGNAASNGYQDAYTTGDTGYVDLAKTFDTGGNEDTARARSPPSFTPKDRAEETEGNEDSEDELALDDRTDQDLTTSPGHLSPLTPFIAGNKRDCDGNIVSPIRKTPAPDYTALFPDVRNRAAVGLSQVFEQTQADSSPPLQNDPRSDPIFERPSPDYPRIRQTRHRATTSSPTTLRKNKAQTSMAEPRCSYLPLNESQLQRERERQFTELVSISPQSDDDELAGDSERRCAEGRRKRKHMHVKAMREMAAIAAPATHKIDRRRKITASETIIGLMTTDKTKRDAIVISSDHAIPEVESSDPESVHDHDELTQAMKSSGPSHKSSTTRKRYFSVNQHKSARLCRPASSPLPAKSGSLSLSFHENNRPRDIPASPEPNSIGNDESKVLSVSRNVAVVNSQPDQSRAQPPRPVLPSSISSRDLVSQSQKQCLSRNLEMVPTATSVENIANTSSLPRPPTTPREYPRENRSEFVGSSPPILREPVIDGAQRNSQQGNISDTPVVRRYQNATLTKPHNEAHHTSSAAFEGHRKNENGRSQRHPNQTESHHVPETSPARSSGPNNNHTLDRYLSPKRTQGPCNELANNEAGPSNGSHSDSHIYDTAPNYQQISPIKKMGEIGTHSSPQTQDVFNFDVAIMDEESANSDATMLRADPSQHRPRKKLKGILRPSQARCESVKAMNALPRLGTPPAGHHRQDREHPAKAPESVRSRPNVDESDQLRPIRAANSKNSSSKATATGAKFPDLQIAETPQAGKDISKTRSRAIESVNEEIKINERKTPGEIHSTTQTTRAPQPPSIAISKLPEVPELFRSAVPNRVFARFNGARPAYYPATCLGLANKAGTAYKVRFEDGNVDLMGPGYLKALEIRVGDRLKIDLKGKRTIEYHVCDLKDKLATAGCRESDLKTDIHGHSTVVLEPRQNGRSSDNAKLDVNQRVEVPVSNVYLTKEMWSRFGDRPYEPLVGRGSSGLHCRTPSNVPSAPSTPSSRSRRFSKSHSVARWEKLSEKIGLFSGMAFAITFSDRDEDEKESVKDLISNNGGHVLDDGLRQLFDPVMSCDPVAPPGSPQTSKALAKTDNLQLAPFASDLGFAALIADTYSRRTKYLEALALDIPCLSKRWVVECVSRDAILAWGQYLLPAGKSFFIDGAIRSRTLPESSWAAAEEARLTDTICHRSQLLRGQNVILVTKDEARRKAYLFLTSALGAARVESVKHNTAAKALLDGKDGPMWHWVFVDDGIINDAMKVLTGPDGKKRKRNSANQANKKDVKDYKFKVASEELVIQSLIMGALMEP